jgi:hypothetical protein
LTESFPISVIPEKCFSILSGTPLSFAHNQSGVPSLASLGWNDGTWVIDRILDSESGNVTIETLQKVARIVGKELRVELV